MKNNIIKSSSILTLLLVVFSIACYANESNLDNFTYPSHQCGKKLTKPSKPARLASFEDIDGYNNAITDYNIQVTEYNKAIKTYKSCINLYIKNGNHDINIIRTKLNKALKDARAK